ncbi:MAG: hypothetical protein ACE5IR_27325 [bacterium]
MRKPFNNEEIELTYLEKQFNKYFYYSNDAKYRYQQKQIWERMQRLKKSLAEKMADIGK